MQCTVKQNEERLKASQEKYEQQEVQLQQLLSRNTSEPVSTEQHGSQDESKLLQEKITQAEQQISELTEELEAVSCIDCRLLWIDLCSCCR